MDTIFTNSENSKTSESTHRLLFKLSGKTDFACCFIKSDYLLCMEKYKKRHAKTINLKSLGQRGMQNLNYLINHILHQIFKTILSIP